MTIAVAAVVAMSSSPSLVVVVVVVVVVVNGFSPTAAVHSCSVTIGQT
jgi:hypothetical protein